MTRAITVSPERAHEFGKLMERLEAANSQMEAAAKAFEEESIDSETFFERHSPALHEASDVMNSIQNFNMDS